MKYLRGYLTAGIFGAITWVLMAYGQRFSTLVDMVYPYVTRNLQDILAQWSSQVDFCLWQLLAVALGVLLLCSVVLMIVLKWNVVQWLGWVLAVFSCIYTLHTAVFGLNFYAGPISEDLRLDMSPYTLEELTEATEYYRNEANALAAVMPRKSDGTVSFRTFEELAAMAGEGFETLTYQKHYPIFAGSTVPVKKLGWSDMYVSMGITGFSFALTGEAAVNPQAPDVSLPFTMCHEMSHRMCIANERDANFAAFLAASNHSDPQFRYSAYFMAYRYCMAALSTVTSQAAVDARARVDEGVSDYLRYDMAQYDAFYRTRKNASATKAGDAVNNAYLKTSGDASGLASYGEVCDLLVSWHVQQVLLPSLAEEENPFDPLDKTQVDLTGIVHAGGN
ncbi:MAG: DUF3810 domain-containing protein [Candidatus Faecousia sp.]|nr:DUF3810 domain-containing protein [Oscillospiraceae bacterium]MDY2557013.1 DUF3810 domain-containing protein [Candidatus Faecousia sp.]